VQCLCQALSGISNICSDVYAKCSPVPADLVLNLVFRGEIRATNCPSREKMEKNEMGGTCSAYRGEERRI
jgi:hypothetical protein